MNKSFTKVIFILFLFAVNNVYSQLVTPFTAEEGYSNAVIEAEKEISNPLLLAIGTINTKVENEVISEISIDLTDGKSETWVYVFEDANTKERSTIVLIRVFIVWQNIASSLGDILSSFEAIVPNTVVNGDWVDSKQAVEWLVADSEYLLLKNKYPNANPGLVGMGNNEFEIFLNENEPYWTIFFNDGENSDGAPRFTCFIHAITGEIICQEAPNSVEERLSNIEGYKPSFPQPANDFINIFIPENLIDLNANLLVYDLNGLQVSTYKLSDVYNNGWANINTTQLQNGLYILRYESNRGRFTERIDVIK